ncbi:MAG: sorbitol dehydrogenase [Planctomycetes bacterium GWF2_42_9]|nr:MAG: sorbitol dehydrogenase [Planctomycetes bacterium GWF2_42_9]
MKAVIVVEANKVEVVDIKEPKVGPYQAKVKTEVATLCNATDGKLIAGHFPGVTKYPLVLGHESAGIVQEIGDKVRNFKVGDRVIGGLVFDYAEPNYASGWGGFCEYTLANDHDAMVADGVADEKHGWHEVYEIQTAVSSDVSVEDAVLLCTWREVYSGFEDFNLKKGNTILVFGAGPVGLSFVKIGKLLGLDYIGVVEPVESKRKKALEMGADAVFRLEDDFRKEFPRTLDAVIDAVGKPSIVNTSLELIKMGGSVCVYGVIGESSFTIDKYKGPYDFNLYVHQWPTRFRERAAQQPLCQCICAGKLSAKDLITHEFNIEQINEAIYAVQSSQTIKILFRY